MISLPKLGTLFAACATGAEHELRYRAGPLVGETVSVHVGGRRVARRSLAPGRHLRFVSPIRRMPASGGGADRSAAIRLVVRSRSQPFDIRARVVVSLASAEDGTGECVARTAEVDVATVFH